jgi:protein-S-isoprenylcysteine O-methyltransferase Ste14
MKVFDLRFPLGYLFVTLGVLLIIAGMLAAPDANARSLGMDINRIWGSVMVGFGILSLGLAWRERRRRRRTLVSDQQK